jgi:hypothetical protein
VAGGAEVVRPVRAPCLLQRDGRHDSESIAGEWGCVSDVRGHTEHAGAFRSHATTPSPVGLAQCTGTGADLPVGRCASRTYSSDPTEITTLSSVCM